MPTSLTFSIGTLRLGGDWACAHGDASGLRYVAQQLAALLEEPRQGELLELAAECYRDADRAATMWSVLKDRPARAPSGVHSRMDLHDAFP